MPADIGTLTPEQMLQQQQILRQQKMAEMLMQKGMEQPQGQMIGNRFVPPSFTQYLSGLANTYVGQKGIEKGDQAQIDLAKAIRGQESAALGEYMGQLQGKPAVIQDTELAGPYAGNVPMPTAQKEISPAVQGNPMLANMSALQNPNSPAFLRAHAMKKITEGPNWSEVSQVDPKTGNTDTYVYDKNSADPKSTMRFVATSKPAIGVAESIRLRDEGLLPAGMGNLSVSGGNAPMVAGTPMGGNVSMGGGNLPANPSVKPTLVKNDEVIKEFGYNPFEAPKPPPTLTTGPQIRKFYADQATALPAESQKTVKGAINYQKAVGDLQNEFAGYSDADLVKPTVRAKLQQKLTNAYLLGKEANTLGALTGPDLGLLEKLVTDPTAFSSLILDRKTINSLYDAQRKSAGDTIRESYRLDLKPVPTDLRNHIMVKPYEMLMPKTDIKSVLKAQNIPYDPSYEYKVNPDGTVARRKKQ
jgi:hypothetical protein